VGSRGGVGRVAGMAVALAVGLLLALASAARGEVPVIPGGLAVVGGDEWRAENDFGVFWTNPADAQVVGARWQLAGGGLASGVEFTPGAGIAELEHVRLPYAGLWYLSVWLRDASGWESDRFAATVTLRLDDAAPTVSFLPGDAQVLAPQLVAVVADPLSGVADGTISYRRLDEERWTDLPTQIALGALGTQLAAVTPELKPGTAYLFRAEARDGAGNVGTTTLRADGAAMSLRAPRDGAGGAGGAEADGVRSTRLEVALGGGRGGERGGSGPTVDAGEGAVLRGRLVGGDRLVGKRGDREAVEGLADKRLRVFSHPARGARGGIESALVTTGPDGRFELRLPPGPSRRIVVAFAGGDGLAAARRRLALRVRGAVSLAATPRRLRTGGLLRLRGRVGSRGARVPRAGKLVTISYWETASRRWRPVIVTRTDRAGRYRAAYRFRYVSGHARIRLRATAPAEADWPYAPGSSRPLTVEVRGR
jgi:hypothetical protein